MQTEKLPVFFEKVFYESPVPTVIGNTDHFIFANESFATLTGYSEKEVMTLNFDILTPQGIKQISHKELITGLSTTLKHNIAEVFVKKKNNHVIMVELSFVSHSFEDSIYTVFFIRDISLTKTREQKIFENEKRLEMALQATNQAVWDWNCLTDETYYSPEYFRILGYQPYEFTPSYNKWVELMHPDDREVAEQSQKKYLDSINDKYEIDFRLRKKDGTYIWTHTRAKIIERNLLGTPVRIMGIVIDIDEKRKKEEKLNLQTQKLLNFTFFTSHVLRAPVATILSLFELRRAVPEGDYYDYMEKCAIDLDAIIHKLNSQLQELTYGESSSNIKPVQEHEIPKQITILDKDEIFHLSLRKALTNINPDINTKIYTQAEEVLISLGKGKSDTGPILIDITITDTNIWDFLDKVKKLHLPDISIYLLAGDPSIEDLERAKKYSFVKGYLLKPLNIQKLYYIFEENQPNKS